MATKETSMKQEEITKNERTNKIEEAKYIYDNVQSMIRFADSKIGILFSILSAIYVILGAYIITFIKSINWKEIKGIQIASIVIFALSVFFYMVTVAFIVKAIRPRYIGSKYETKKRNLYYFVDTASYKDQEELAKDFEDKNYDDYLNMIFEQITINSRISKEKMNCVFISAWGLFISVGLNLLSIFFSLFA